MKIRFIVNPIAGGKKRIKEVEEGVSKVFSGINGLFEVKATAFKGDGFRFAKEAVERGYDTVFACGGDGTINEVASALINKNVTLGIVPTGSGNALANALQIPFNVEESVGLAVKGSIREIDVGSAADRFFFSTAGVGFDAVVSKIYGEWTGKRSRRGILPYVPIALTEYFNYRAHPVIVKWDERFLKIHPLLLTVANTKEYGARVIIAPGAIVDDGVLDISIVEDRGFFHAIFSSIKLFKGKIDTSKYFRSIKASHLEVETDMPQLVHVDGESFESGKKVVFKVLHKALKVWVV